jgi:hypothetical protein
MSAGCDDRSYKNADTYRADQPILNVARVFKAAKVYKIVYILLCYTVALCLTRNKTFHRPFDISWLSWTCQLQGTGVVFLLYLSLQIGTQWLVVFSSALNKS